MINKKVLIVFILGMFLFSLNSVSAIDYPSTQITITWGGNLTNLSQLLDTNIASPTDGYVLTWNDTAKNWYPESAAAVGDTNESTRFNNLIGTDCSVGDYVFGVALDGTLNCSTPTSSGNASWNQSYASTLFAPNTTEGIQLLINSTGVYSTYNATYAASVGNASWNQSYANTIYILSSEEPNLNVNSSQSLNSSIGYINDINDTQFNLVGFLLTLDESWLDTVVAALGYIKDLTGLTTDDLNQGSTNLYDNVTWNETYADTLYAATGTTGNASFNESYTNNLYVNIDGDNMTGALVVDSSGLYDIAGGTDTNDMLVLKANTEDGKPNIAIYGNGDGINLNANAGENIIFVDDDTGFATWNKAGSSLSSNLTLNAGNFFIGDGSYLTGIIGTSYNATYDATTLEWDGNKTALIGCVNNGSYLSTYNATYASSVGNVSWNESYADTLYAPNTTEGIQLLINSTNPYSTYNETYASFNETNLINSVNTTENIQTLLNSTGIYSTYNATYAANTGNASWNESYANGLYSKLNASVQFANLTLSEKITFALGEIIDNIVDGWITITGSLDVGGEIKALDWTNVTINVSQIGDANVLNQTSLALGINTTGNIQALLNSTGIYSTYNATYEANTGNASWNQSYANTLYAPNTTEGIQLLINSTNPYSTYNETYDAKISFNNTNVAYFNNSNTFAPNQAFSANVSIAGTNFTVNTGCSEYWNGTCSIKYCPTTTFVYC